MQSANFHATAEIQYNVRHVRQMLFILWYCICF